ncbi:Gp37Gp68 family protein [Paraburkholderia piptadeniae]|uniref:Gp37Gp68 family protein n=1 Tax=Paraburkholderia piptadeniae TaxID=1701573 RepID=A0A1N7S8R4_9BURK|nr:phage Gp37/Gp68 family protein [Paraburkholderia piptadeniae]SIT43764.1 Gp37Gp68 family protein [Paraburkholderia piptadeniae]
MSENSKIEWTDHTFNPWEGCQKVGPGCDHCYAEARNARFGGGTAVNWGPSAPRRRTSAANWRKPLHWNAMHGNFLYQHGRRQRVFCASLADVFDNAVDPAWRADLFALIKQTPNLDWLLLTKRIGNVPAMLAEIGIEGLPWNVWLGATIVNQAEADRDIPKLLDVPARVRFLSMEPLLGPVDIRPYMWPVCGWWKGPHNSYREAKAAGAECGLKRQALVSAHARFVDWVIVGGESGHGARPMNPWWARSLRDQCEAAGTKFLFKQWGEWTEQTPEQQKQLPGSVIMKHVSAWPDGTLGHGDFRENGGYGRPVFPVGKKAAGRLLDGRTHDEFPRGAA